MYTIEEITPPTTEPVSVAELKAHLRINDTSEDSLLAGFIKSAREMFERLTGRSVHPTTLRQHIPYFTGTVYLMRGPVRSIGAVKYWDGNDTLQTATVKSDIISLPASIWMQNYPVTSTTVSPKAYVEFDAGWDTSKVPEVVKTAIRLLAAHYYANRESHTTDDLKDIPMGFKAVTDQFNTGLIGNWGF